MAGTESRSSRHILVYGPPAAGKLTVARCLAAQYGLKVLDNHVSVDAALRLFDFGTRPYADLVETLRVALLGAAAREGVDVVSTLVYAHPVDRGHVDRLVGTSQAGGAVVTFVQLLPGRSVLEQRTSEPSRAESGKIREVATLRRLLDSYDLSTPIHPGDLSIDNSDLHPEEVAALIGQEFGLTRTSV